MIVLDTHVLVWWVANPEKLSKRAQEKIAREVKKGGQLLASSISVWEIYLLVAKNKLSFSVDVDTWLEKVESLPFMQFVPVDNKIAAKSVNLPEPLHSDPTDRIIIATALQNGADLITSDKRILAYPSVRSIW